MKRKNIEAISFIVIFAAIMGVFIYIMGISNFFGTLTNTAYYLLMNVVWFILAIAVLTSAFSELLSEFHVVDLLNKLLSPVMKILYKLPGVASIGIITTYLSDNPAIISLAYDKKFRNKFTKKQLPALCNLGTSFGMGLIVSTTLIAIDNSFLLPVIVGNIGAIVGSIVSTRIMLRLIKNVDFEIEIDDESKSDESEFTGNVFERVINALLDGGKNGVKIGMQIIPGVIVISTFVMLLTFGPDEKTGDFLGGAKEGIGALPFLANKLDFVIQPLFGFTSPEAISFPLTALGSTGAALGLIPSFIEQELISTNDIAVFCAMGMVWSGYLSTHISMMDSLGVRKLANKAIISHTFGGIAAGIFANYLFILLA